MISKGANNWNHSLYHACLSGHLKIMNFMVSKGANNLHNCYQWPTHKIQIIKLLYLKTPLTAFQQLNDFRELNNLVTNTKHAIINS